DREANQNVVQEMENSGFSRSQAFDYVYGEAYRNELERIKNLVLKKQLAKVELFITSKKPHDDAVKEGWTDEMLEFYKATEVGEDLSAHAGFMTQNMVSSTVDASMADMVNNDDAVMHFKIKLIQDKRSFFISFIYGENDHRDRLNLWSNLSDHMDLVNNRPWSMLGDFNVTMNAYEHSKGVVDIYKGVNEFRSCMEKLDMEDLAMNGMFFTWVQKMKDPEKGILKKLDKVMGNSSFFELFGSCYANFLPYVTSDNCLALLVMSDVTIKKRRAFKFMNFLADKKEFEKTVKENWSEPVKGYAMFVFAKRLKGMKRHLRDLNKKNGNVHDKVKMI
ncbi:abscisic acid 8'-hydroxylase 3-like protein, partial [Tanacetum coccineum]